MSWRQTRVGMETPPCQNCPRRTDAPGTHGEVHEWSDVDGWYRALDEQGRREALPVEQEAGARCREGRHAVFRARLVDGLSAHFRLARAGPAVFLGDGLVRAT